MGRRERSAAAPGPFELAQLANRVVFGVTVVTIIPTMHNMGNIGIMVNIPILTIFPAAKWNRNDERSVFADKGQGFTARTVWYGTQFDVKPRRTGERPENRLHSEAPPI